MFDFDLASIDWNSVRLIQAGQFIQETYYLEELARWMLQYGRISGILHLEDDGVSRPSPEGTQMYSVKVKGLFAVAEAGSVIHLPDEDRLALTGIVEAIAPTVPLFVGVSRVEKAPEPQLHSALDTGLIQCGGLRRKYTLATDKMDTNYDWLQVAQFEKTTMGLSPDPRFIPDCMFLSSCAALWQAQKDVKSLATQLLALLEQHSTDALPVYSAAMILAGSTGPAARMVDGNLHPRAYMDRLVGVIAAYRSQLGALPNLNLTTHQQALDQLIKTLRLFENEWTMGQAFEMVKECFELMLRLIPELLGKLGNVQAPVFRQEPERDVYVPKEPPRAPQPQPRPGGLWRK